jgi:glycosyltransferase A (GT-A) superfamily protein (DUF2064 family)
MCPDPADSATLILFCRRPTLGVGKQRIAAELGAPLALALSQRLFAAALEDMRAWPGPAVIAPANAEDVGWASDLLDFNAEIIAQPSGNLGERINAIDAQTRASGHSHTLHIASDAPILDLGYFARARAALQRFDIVLGPAADGGVTIMGARVPWPTLAELPWSTEHLGEALEQVCRQDGHSVVKLEERYDIDHTHDLLRLYRDLAGDQRPARKQLRDWIETLELAHV